MATAILLVAAAMLRYQDLRMVGPGEPANPQTAVPRDPPGIVRKVERKRNPIVIVHGKASWYGTGRNGLYAAACRPLRRALGPHWRGQRVLVSNGKAAVEVRLNDFCASRTKTIDLSDEAFSALAPLSRGILQVTIEGFR